MTTKEYMPEVGEPCEFSYSSRENWCKTSPIAFNDGRVWLPSTGLIVCKSVKFRPIKTPAEIEREEAIEAMKAISIITIGDGMARLYDAGYKPVGDEVSDIDIIAEQVNHYFEDNELCVHASDLFKKFKIYQRGE